MANTKLGYYPANGISDPDKIIPTGTDCLLVDSRKPDGKSTVLTENNDGYHIVRYCDACTDCQLVGVVTEFLSIRYAN